MLFLIVFFILFILPKTQIQQFDFDDTALEPITMHNGDEYFCRYPETEAQAKQSKSVYTGPGPLDILAKLFASSTCTYRIESYWTYEVCHGNYIKQYHEEREGKTSKLQEYILGRWDKLKTEKLRERLADAEKRNEKLKYKKIDGLSLPYVELELTDGTVCELNNNEPRRIKVLYVCYAQGKNDVYSLNEVSSCQYEMIILTPILCAHPDFKPQEVAENKIRCFRKDGKKAQPKASWTNNNQFMNYGGPDEVRHHIFNVNCVNILFFYRI